MTRTGGADAEERLRAHLAAIIDSSDDAILSKDLEGIITSWNAGAARLYGYTADEVLGRPVSMLVPEEHAEEIPAIMSRLRRGERISHYETVRRTKKGRIVHVSLTVSPILDRNGNVMGASAVARDITERKRAEREADAELRVHKRLQAISGRLIEAGDVQALYGELIDVAIEITEAQWGSMQRLDTERDELCLLETRGVPEELWASFARLPLDATTSCAEAVRSGERAVVDYATDERVAGTTYARAHLEAGIRSAQSTPLKTRSGRIVGVLSTHWSGPHGLSSRRLYLLDILARQAADLIDRFLATEALHASERRERLRSEQFEALVERAPMGVYLVDANLRLEQVNPVAQTVFGEHPGGVLGRDLREVLLRSWGPEGLADIEPIFRRTIETGEPYHAAEFVERRRDRGTLEYYDWRIERITLPDGRPGAVCYFRDVSEQVKARLAIQKSEERYRTLFETISEGFCILEPIFDEEGRPVDYRYVECNPAYVKQTGRTPAIGRTVREVQPDVEGFWIDVYGRVALTGEPARVVDYAHGLDRWFESEAFPIGDPEERKVAVLFTDITERRRAEVALRESEERLRLAKAAAKIGIHDYNVASGEVSWDHRTRDIWGVDQDEPVTYELWLEGIHPEDRDRAHRAVQRALDPSDDTGYFTDYRVIHRTTGLTRWIQVTGRPSFSDGRAVRLVGTVHDITDRKLAEEALRDANRRKDEFLATLAHELRNPLAAIRTAVGVMDVDEGDPALVGRMSSIIDRQSSQLVRLIDDLLDVSRISRGMLKLDRARVDLTELVRNAVADARGACDERGLEVTVSTPDDPLPVDADALRLSQVLNNLLHNACKFTPQGGQIRVSARRDGHEAVVGVADTGAGMRPEELTRIFEMFARGAGPLTGPSEGLGIGLSLAKYIIDLHGGSIEARSSGPGEGSEFIVRLGLADATPQLVGDRPESADGERGRAATGIRIVTAEDNRDVLEVIALMLRMHGHEVVTAPNGIEALEKVREHRPDVVLLDIGMPLMNGYEVARRIRRESWGQDMLLVAMTGWGQEKDKRMALEAGFDTHLTKPVEIKVLQKILAER